MIVFKYLQILIDTDLKILLDYQVNYVGNSSMMDKDATSFDTLTISLSLTSHCNVATMLLEYSMLPDIISLIVQ